MLFDGISITEGGNIANATIASGSAFPSNPNAGELFYRTDSPNDGLYVYDGAEWSIVGTGTVSFDALNVKQAARAATTTNITLSGTQTIDGVALAVGERVLVKNQTTASQNGIYVVSSGAWSRSSDFDGSPTNEVQSGDFCFVAEGTTNGDTGWVLTTDGTITIGSTALVFAQFTGANSVPGGASGTIQFNDAGSFGGVTGFTVNQTTGGLTYYVGNKTAPGNLSLIAAGSSAGTAGEIQIIGGETQTGNGGIASLRGGTSFSAGGNGGLASVSGGGANTGNGNGGSVSISGGVVNGTGTAGNVTLSGGTHNGSGVSGVIRLRTNNLQRFEVTGTGALSIGTTSTAYGTSGQVLTSNGNAAPSWQTIGTVTSATNIDGGDIWQIPFQTAAGVTDFNSALRWENTNASQHLRLGTVSTGLVRIKAENSLSIETRDGQYTFSAGPGVTATANDTSATAADFHGADHTAGRRAGPAVFRGGDTNGGSGTSTGGDVTLRGGNNTDSSSAGDVIIAGGINSGGGTDGTIFLQTAGEDRLRILPSGNINFIGTGASRRIYADFSSAGATRAYLQSSTASGFSNVGILPGAGGTGASVAVWGGDNPEATSFAQLGHSSSLGYSYLDSGSSTGGTVRPMVFRIAPSAGTTPAEVARITTAGAWSFGSTGTATGTAGQVLTSSGSGAAPVWAAPAAVAAAAGTLTGTTLAANVVNSSLTSVGTLSALTVAGGIRATGVTGGYATASNLVMIGTDGSSQPTNIWNNGSATLNNRTWAAYVQSNGGFQISPVNESGVYGSAISMTRSNTTTSLITLTGTAINLAGLTSGLQLNGSAGTSGQVLTSNGSASAPTWQTGVTLGGTNTFTGTNTFNNALTVGTPSSANHATTKTYVDTIAQGLTTKPSVRAATTGNLTATYSNGTSGVGATLTGTGALPTIDGVTLAVGNGVLVKDQTAALQNGRYNVTTLSPNWVLTRCSLCDEATEIPGAFVFVNEGTQAATGWVQTVANAGTFVVGTDAISVSQFSSAGSYTAGAGLTLSGNDFNIGTASTGRIVVNADNIDLATVADAGTGSFLKLTRDGYGRVSGTAAVASSDITTALGYTPVNRAVTVSDWNSYVSGQYSLISGFTNSVNGTTVISGAYFPHASGGFGMQLAGRLDNLYLRTQESDVWSTWKTVVHSGNFSTYASAYVVKAGDTMTGDLTINKNNAALRLSEVGTYYGQISTDSGGSVSISADATNVASNSRIAFNVDGAERMRIVSDGSVGVGTTSPGQFIDFKRDQNTATLLRVQNSTSGTGAYVGLTLHDGVTNKTQLLTMSAGYTTLNQFVADSSVLNAGGGGGLSIASTNASTGVIRLYSGGVAERMRINAAGDVGIGTVGPTNYGAGYVTSAINGTNAGVREWQVNSVRQAHAFANSNSFTLGSVTALPVLFQTTNTERMRIDTLGNVALGTSSAGYRLHVAAESASAVGVFRDLDVTSVGAAGTFIELGARNGASFVAGAQVQGVLNNPATTGYLALSTLSSTMQERMRITADGNVGVGVTTPSGRLSVATNAADPTSLMSMRWNSGRELWAHETAGNSRPLTIRAQSLTYADDSAARFTVDTSGNLVIGHTASVNSSVATTSVAPRLQTHGTTVATSSISASRFNNDNTSPFLFFNKSRATGVGNQQIVAADDDLMAITAAGSDGTRFTEAGRIMIEVDGTPSADVMPGRMAFFTNSGTNVVTEKMRINSAGEVLIGASAAGVAKFFVAGNALIGSGLPNTATSPGYAGTFFGFDSVNNIAVLQAVNQSTASMAFHTKSSLGAAPVERMRIAAGGDVLIGKTGIDLTNPGVYIEAVGTSGATANARMNFIKGSASGTGATTAIGFYYAGTAVGSVTTTSTVTAYNTSSDVRLKDNIVDAPSALDKVKALQVRSYDWKADGSHVDHGFIAQELNEVEPLAVTQGETWAIDPSKLVATLTKALQEALVRIDALEAEVQALKK